MRDALYAFQNELFLLARKIREGGNEVVPIVFFLTPQGIIPLLLHMEKDLWRPAILHGIAQLEAFATVLHMEAWVVEGPQVPVAIASGWAGLTSLEEYPGRKEALFSVLESVEGLQRTLKAPIEEGKLGDTCEAEVELFGGRVAGLFQLPSGQDC